ncbi:hypothetical protein NEDG_00847 [Nematocida displodere]|uniref:Uncharacterized protein n=1 Tax=Nematocida displodere TaxID=1805483 RepID=A0A177ECN7_9MICR|nr:hypothetical protein NEDG_00847 [Nematocida displodere]
MKIRSSFCLLPGIAYLLLFTIVYYYMNANNVRIIGRGMVKTLHPLIIVSSEDIQRLRRECKCLGLCQCIYVLARSFTASEKVDVLVHGLRDIDLLFRYKVARTPVLVRDTAALERPLAPVSLVAVMQYIIGIYLRWGAKVFLGLPEEAKYLVGGVLSLGLYLVVLVRGRHLSAAGWTKYTSLETLLSLESE